MSAPLDPHAELRALALYRMAGPSYWALRPLARLDLAVGAYDAVSSADVPGLTAALVAALPPLLAHECSEGRAGGFVLRLEQGTYAPHIVEHAALALQELAGHDVGYGRSRDGRRAGEYVVVAGYRHADVGLRALALALDLVRRAFAGALAPADAAAAVATLREVAAHPDPHEAPPDVAAAVTGGDAAVRRRVAEALGAVDVDPAALFTSGLPYRRARLGVVLDVALDERVPAPYREPDRALRLVTTVLDAVQPGGTVAVPAHDAELVAHAESLASRARVHRFTTPDELEALHG